MFELQQTIFYNLPTS